MEQKEKKGLKARPIVETEAPSPSKDSLDAQISTERRGRKVSRIRVETAVPLGEPSSSGLSRQQDVTDKVVSLIKDSKGKAAGPTYDIKVESGKKSGSVGAAKVKQPGKQHGAPTRPKSAYMFFLGEFRKQFGKEHPGTPASQMAICAGEAWRSMTTEDKAKYNALSEEDKERYAREAKDFEASTKSEKVRRPRGPFLFFLEDYKCAYQTLSQGGQKMTVMTKLASERWKNMTSEEKQPYVEKAKASKEEYRNLKSEMEAEGRSELVDKESTELKQLWQLLPGLQESTRGSIIGTLPSTLPPLKIPKIQKEPSISPIFSSGISSGSTESVGGHQLPAGVGLSTEGLRKHLNQQLGDLIKKINSQAPKDHSSRLVKAMTIQRPPMPPEKQTLPAPQLGSTQQISTFQLLSDMEHCKQIIESFSGEQQQQPIQSFIKGTPVTVPMGQVSSREIQTQMHTAIDPTTQHMEARPGSTLLPENLQTPILSPQGARALRTESEIFRGQPLELHTHKPEPQQKKRSTGNKSAKTANSSSD